MQNSNICFLNLGKAESVWDYFAHNYPDKIADLSNGDVTCNAYEKYIEDIRLMKDMGVCNIMLYLNIRVLENIII